MSSELTDEVELAANEADLRARLEQQGFTVASITRVDRPASVELSVDQRSDLRKCAAIARHMAGLLDAALIENSASEAYFMLHDAAVAFKELNETFSKFEVRD
jgi:type II secretory pathway component PulF